MKKWFNTNYWHIWNPKFENNRGEIGWSQDFDEYQEAKELGINTQSSSVDHSLSSNYLTLKMVKAEDF